MEQKYNIKNALHLGEAISEKPLSGEVILKRDNKAIRNILIDEVYENLTPAQILYASIDKLLDIKFKDAIKTYNFTPKTNNDKVNHRIEEVIKFLVKHSSLVGKEQAIIDLQRGLSILNRNRRHSKCECKNILLQDGLYGDKTYNCLCEVCKNYTVNIIKKYIKIGILNNVLFDTKDNEKIDTEALIRKTYLNLEDR